MTKDSASEQPRPFVEVRLPAEYDNTWLLDVINTFDELDYEVKFLPNLASGGYVKPVPGGILPNVYAGIGTVTTNTPLDTKTVVHNHYTAPAVPGDKPKPPFTQTVIKPIDADAIGKRFLDKLNEALR